MLALLIVGHPGNCSYYWRDVQIFQALRTDDLQKTAIRHIKLFMMDFPHIIIYTRSSFL